MMLDIIYQDQWLIAFHKPAGLLSVPGRLPQHKDSLASRAQVQWPEIRVVHRLDCETSGVMIMALDELTHKQLNRLFHDRLVHKEYLAVCSGRIEQDTGEINLPLITDWPNRPRQMVDHQKGKNALTRFRVLEREESRTRVLLLPVTGRTHQLRVHLKEMGHPILGDSLYAPEPVRQQSPRLLLHAAKLEFEHPGSGEPLTLTAPCTF